MVTTPECVDAGQVGAQSRSTVQGCGPPASSEMAWHLVEECHGPVCSRKTKSSQECHGEPVGGARGEDGSNADDHGDGVGPRGRFWLEKTCRWAARGTGCQVPGSPGAALWTGDGASCPGAGRGHCGAALKPCLAPRPSGFSLLAPRVPQSPSVPEDSVLSP